MESRKKSQGLPTTNTRKRYHGESIIGRNAALKAEAEAEDAWRRGASSQNNIIADSTSDIERAIPQGQIYRQAKENSLLASRAAAAVNTPFIVSSADRAAADAAAGAAGAALPTAASSLSPLNSSVSFPPPVFPMSFTNIPTTYSPNIPHNLGAPYPAAAAASSSKKLRERSIKEEFENNNQEVYKLFSKFPKQTMNDIVTTYGNDNEEVVWVEIPISTKSSERLQTLRDVFRQIYLLLKINSQTPNTSVMFDNITAHTMALLALLSVIHNQLIEYQEEKKIWIRYQELTGNRKQNQKVENKLIKLVRRFRYLSQFERTFLTDEPLKKLFGLDPSQRNPHHSRIFLNSISQSEMYPKKKRVMFVDSIVAAFLEKEVDTHVISYLFPEYIYKLDDVNLFSQGRIIPLFYKTGLSQYIDMRSIVVSLYQRFVWIYTKRRKWDFTRPLTLEEPDVQREEIGVEGASRIVMRPSWLSTPNMALKAPIENTPEYSYNVIQSILQELETLFKEHEANTRSYTGWNTWEPWQKIIFLLISVYQLFNDSMSYYNRYQAAIRDKEIAATNLEKAKWKFAKLEAEEASKDRREQARKEAIVWKEERQAKVVAAAAAEAANAPLQMNIAKEELTLAKQATVEARLLANTAEAAAAAAPGDLAAATAAGRAKARYNAALYKERKAEEKALAASQKALSSAEDIDAYIKGMGARNWSEINATKSARAEREKARNVVEALRGLRGNLEKTKKHMEEAQEARNAANDACQLATEAVKEYPSALGIKAKNQACNAAQRAEVGTGLAEEALEKAKKEIGHQVGEAAQNWRKVNTSNAYGHLEFSEFFKELVLKRMEEAQASKAAALQATISARGFNDALGEVLDATRELDINTTSMSPTEVITTIVSYTKTELPELRDRAVDSILVSDAARQTVCNMRSWDSICGTQNVEANRNRVQTTANTLLSNIEIQLKQLEDDVRNIQTQQEKKIYATTPDSVKVQTQLDLERLQTDALTRANGLITSVEELNTIIKNAQNPEKAALPPNDFNRYLHIPQEPSADAEKAAVESAIENLGPLGPEVVGAAVLSQVSSTENKTAFNAKVAKRDLEFIRQKALAAMEAQQGDVKVLVKDVCVAGKKAAEAEFRVINEKEQVAQSAADKAQTLLITTQKEMSSPEGPVKDGLLQAYAQRSSSIANEAKVAAEDARRANETAGQQAMITKKYSNKTKLLHTGPLRANAIIAEAEAAASAAATVADEAEEKAAHATLLKLSALASNRAIQALVASAAAEKKLKETPQNASKRNAAKSTVKEVADSANEAVKKAEELRRLSEPSSLRGIKWKDKLKEAIPLAQVSENMTEKASEYLKRTIYFITGKRGGSFTRSHKKKQRKTRKLKGGRGVTANTRVSVPLQEKEVNLFIKPVNTKGKLATVPVKSMANEQKINVLVQSISKLREYPSHVIADMKLKHAVTCLKEVLNIMKTSKLE